MKYIRFIWLLISSIPYNIRYGLGTKYYRTEVPLSSIPKFRYMDKKVFKASQSRYPWERLEHSIKTYGYGFKPIRLAPNGIDFNTGEKKYVIKDGNHRFTVLTDIYGPEHRISVYVSYKQYKDIYDIENVIKQNRKEDMSEMIKNYNKLKKETIKKHEK